MQRLALLDTGVLGMLTYPRKNPHILAWLQRLQQSGFEIRVTEIADYEVRREALRKKFVEAIERLNALKVDLGYIPITTAMMLRAAEFWAEAREQGTPTADPKELDADVILAAQADLLIGTGLEVVIVTTNVGHLARFVPAKKWNE